MGPTQAGIVKLYYYYNDNMSNVVINNINMY